MDYMYDCVDVEVFDINGDYRVTNVFLSNKHRNINEMQMSFTSYSTDFKAAEFLHSTSVMLHTYNYVCMRTHSILYFLIGNVLFLLSVLHHLFQVYS